MNYFKMQIRRISRNRMILFGIFAFYFSAISVALAFDSTDSSDQPLMYIVLGLCFAVPSLLFLFFFIQSLVSLSNYTKSRTYKKLAAIATDSVEALNKQVTRELESALIYSGKRLKLCANWVCVQGAFGFHLKSTQRLVWAYKHITRTNYGATYYAVMFAFDDKKRLQAGLKNDEQCTQLLTIISQYYPHVLIGYSKPLYRLYKSNLREFMQNLPKNAAPGQ